MSRESMEPISTQLPEAEDRVLSDLDASIHCCATRIPGAEHARVKLDGRIYRPDPVAGAAPGAVCVASAQAMVGVMT